MSTPDLLEFASLLKPCSAEQPCGKNLREDLSPTSLYHGNEAIKQKRQKAGEIERKHPDKDKEQDEYYFFRQSLDEWRQIDVQARIILAEHSKDLEITAWLIEALVRLHGFAGLRDGFRLASELIANFWDDLYPVPDAEDDFPRVWPLVGLNGFGQDIDSPLVRAIWRVSLITLPTVPPDPPDFPPITHTYLGYKTQKEAIKNSVVKEASPEIFTTLRDDIVQCQEQFADLCHILDEKCGANKFPSSHITKALTDCRDAIRDLSNGIGPVGGKDEANTHTSDNSNGINITQANLSSRENALQSILQVANYFERTEPHSPVSSLLRKAVHWARMPYAELLDEMIPDEGARKKVLALTGINSKSK